MNKALAAVTSLAHATLLIGRAGTRVLTAPLLRGRIGHLLRQGGPPPAPDRLDAALVSHLHHDHADWASLRMLPDGTEVIGPPGIGRIAKGSREVVPGEEVRI